MSKAVVTGARFIKASIFQQLKSSESFRQLLTYGVIGVVNNLTAFSIYLFVTYLGVEPKIAMSILYLIGATLSYVGNRRWSFKHEGEVKTSFPKYVVAHLGGISINYAMLVVFVDQMGYPHQWVQGLAIFVVAAYLFLAMKLLVFAPSAK